MHIMNKGLISRKNKKFPPTNKGKKRQHVGKMGKQYEQAINRKR